MEQSPVYGQYGQFGQYGHVVWGMIVIAALSPPAPCPQPSTGLIVGTVAGRGPAPSEYSNICKMATVPMSCSYVLCWRETPLILQQCVSKNIGYLLHGGHRNFQLSYRVISICPNECSSDDAYSEPWWRLQRAGTAFTIFLLTPTDNSLWLRPVEIRGIGHIFSCSLNKVKHRPRHSGIQLKCDGNNFYSKSTTSATTRGGLEGRGRKTVYEEKQWRSFPFIGHFIPHFQGGIKSN